MLSKLNTHFFYLKGLCQSTFYQKCPVYIQNTKVIFIPIYSATMYSATIMVDINHIKLQHTMLGNILSKLDQNRKK